MKFRKRMLVAALGSAMVLSQGMTASAQPQTPAPQPETKVNEPPVVTIPDDDVLGTTSGNTYCNDLFGFIFTAPEEWILANQDQLVTLNEGLSQDQFRSNIEDGIPVCIVYAQSADGMEVMNVVAENGASYMDSSIQTLTKEDVKDILNEAMSVATSSLESLGATITGASVNTVNFMDQTYYSLDITFDYEGFSGTQKQIGIPAGTYFAMATARSVSGDNTQTTLDMFSAF